MFDLLMAAGLALAAPAAAAESTVTFRTADGCLIEAVFSAPAKDSYILVNTHGLGSNRSEWLPLQAAAVERKYGYLSLDLRGHGGSKTCGGRQADYRKFTRADWAAASRDIAAAALWLKKKGYAPGRLVFCGASIGANLSLKAAAEGKVKPAGLILLSPGLEYAGVQSLPYLRAGMLIAAAPADQYAWKSSLRLRDAARDKKLLCDFLNGGQGHGAGMFGKPGFIEALLGWVAGL
ncbi:MAG: alpha/beta hydrolase [Elusimicrobiales bacterium]